MLPSILKQITAPPATCRPWWAPQFDTAAHTLVSNGGKAVDGQILVAAEVLRRQAEKAVGGKVTPSTYALARYLASERGDAGTPEEKMALALLALNQARALKTDAYGLLAKRNKWGFAVYGPIHAASSLEAETYHSDYGRWAATTKDPTVRDVLIARFAQEGKADAFIRGGNDQYSGRLLYAAILSDASSGGLLAQAKKGRYWVGPLANVNPLNVFIYAPVKGVPWDSAQGRALVARAKTWLRAHPPGSVGDPAIAAVCARNFLEERAVQQTLGGIGVLALGLGAWAAARHETAFRRLLRRLRA